MVGGVSSVAFTTRSGPIIASTDCGPPDPSLPGPRIRVSLSADTLQGAYDAGAFDLDEMIPGGDVPGIDPRRAVTIELRLADEPASLLATSSREPGVLLGDLVALTEAGRSEHVLLDGANWLVTAVLQEGGLHLTTLHDRRPEADVV